jgi:protein O-GlcNAc transferase
MADTREQLDHAMALHREGRVLEAHEIYRQILDENPRMSEALHNLSMVDIDIGNTDSALALIKRLLAIDPNFVPAYYNMGLARQRTGDIEGALTSYRAALARQPNHQMSLYNSAVILRSQGKIAEAVKAYQTLAKLEPKWPDALANYAEALTEFGKSEEALAVTSRLLAIEESANAHALRAKALLNLERHEEALAACDKALALDPTDVPLVHFRGNMLQILKRYDEAIVAYDSELALAQAQGLSGDTLSNAVSESISVRLTSCAWDYLPVLEDKAKNLTATSANFAIDPFVGLLWNDDPELLLTWAKRWQCRVGDPAPVKRPQRQASGKIRIGYISADFREHAVARLIADLIETHDRNVFEVVGYAVNPDDGSALRRRLAAAFDTFVDLSLLTAQQAAERISEDRTDVLIDLMGHTSNARLGILKRKPAPVIAHYLGYPGSLTIDAVDYFIADATTLPQSDEKYFREAIVRLPTTYQVNSNRDISDRVFTRAEVGLPNAGIVFCGIARQAKLNPDVFDAWMNILRETTSSTLWLLAGTPLIENNLRKEAQARGIDVSRLVFAPFIPAAEYLARHKLADLFLDTWPWGGHTMASDALWAGLPVLTVPSRNFASRVGASLLKAVCLPELICDSRDGYVAKAVELAQNPAQLKSLRDKLERNRKTSPLFDIDRFRREIEAAYREMHERHQRGEKPVSFTASA